VFEGARGLPASRQSQAERPRQRSMACRKKPLKAE